MKATARNSWLLTQSTWLSSASKCWNNRCRREDEFLRDFDSPLPLGADESAHALDSLAKLAGKYDVINIKLDKTGGMTEALALAEAARAAGMEIMVGCMLGTSLGMAPGVLVAQHAKYVDLDAPLLLTKDRTPSLTYTGVQNRAARSCFVGLIRMLRLLRRIARRLLRPFRAAQVPPPPSQPDSAPVPTGPILLTSLVPLRATPRLGGRDEIALRDILRSLEIEAAPRAEMQGYVDADYRRFLHTVGLVPNGTGKLLEIGANPYYTTLLLKLFTGYELSLTNYFVDSDPGRTQPGTYDVDGSSHAAGFTYVPVNVERDPFPFADATFDVALFCE